MEVVLSSVEGEFRQDNVKRRQGQVVPSVLTVVPLVTRTQDAAPETAPPSSRELTIVTDPPPVCMTEFVAPSRVQRAAVETAVSFLRPKLSILPSRPAAVTPCRSRVLPRLMFMRPRA